MERLYDLMLAEHLSSHRQMAFVAGPRQVGKTTTCRAPANLYLDWDAASHQRTVIAGQDAVAAMAKLDVLTDAGLPVITFDELHKYPHWKRFLKGMFDVYEDRCRIIVTGSSRLDTYRRGGDSLMGRYFLYRMHPLTVSELLQAGLPDEGIIRQPALLDDEVWQALLRHGGFPEPLLKQSDRFTRRWRRLRTAQVFKEDVRDLTRIQEVALVGVMGDLLQHRSSEQLVTANLAQQVGIAPNTAKAWIEALCALHVGFLVRPWFRNINKSLRKEPKWYLRDWSAIEDSGQRAETFIACHLLKAVEGWTDLGLGEFELRYLRDKQQREVDFVVIRDGRPWFLVEVKCTDTTLSPQLRYFQEQTGADHAFQVVLEQPYVNIDCFTRRKPTVVPARTLLSQLL